MRIRTALICVLSFAAFMATATATEAGAYASVTTRDAAACARACSDDGICMAWIFQRENQCRLMAVVPAQPDSSALAAGYSARAPRALQPSTPIFHAEPVIASAPLASEGSQEPAEQTLNVDDLLGGPSGGDLRL